MGEAERGLEDPWISTESELEGQEVPQRWCSGRCLCLILFDIIGPLS